MFCVSAPCWQLFSFPCRGIPIFLPALSIENPGNFASVLHPLGIAGQGLPYPECDPGVWCCCFTLKVLLPWLQLKFKLCLFSPLNSCLGKGRSLKNGYWNNAAKWHFSSKKPKRSYFNNLIFQMFLLVQKIISLVNHLWNMLLLASGNYPGL